MSYLQRLLNAAPSVLSIAPGNAAPSPVVAHDQRLGQFPDLLDQPLPTQQAELSPQPTPPVEVNRRSPPPAAERAPTAGVALSPLPDPAVTTLPRNRATPAPPPAEAWPTAPATDHPADPAAPRPEAMAAMPLIASSSALSHPPDSTSPARPLSAVKEAAEPGLATHPVPIPALPFPVPAWPIADADFRPLEDTATPSHSHPDKPSGPSQTLPPAPPPAPMTPPPGARPNELQTAPAPAVSLEAPADLAPSPLASGPETTAPPPQPPQAAARFSEQRDVQIVERRVEQLPAPVSTPQPMTAAEVSVIGPIRIGSPGLREMRARGWG